MINIKRVYEPQEKNDGYRILVDRLWPRGMSKQAANIDLWLKDIAPSASLRKWFGHDPERWALFRRKYIAELESNPGLVGQLRRIEKEKHTITLLYGAKDHIHNQAVVLKDFLS